MSETEKDNIETITSFVAAWSRLDAEELAGYFAEDGCYFNIPTEPVRGRDAVKSFITGFTANWTKTQWDILNIAAAGDVVFCERLDRTQTTTGNVDLPCLGVFEMQNGKIREWRDYFDLQTFMGAMSGGS
ncbi:MAG: SgcJ/EcaC family oxidoreductase [Pseudomonadaceae bacterium]|nr:SgcJ/EcaC family oxidoreductase [Pseudomonadaceae bacterium]